MDKASASKRGGRDENAPSCIKGRRVRKRGGRPLRKLAALFRRPAVAAVFAAASIVAVTFLSSESCLIAEYNGSRLFAWPIAAGDEFEVTFIHSLNKSPITDVIEWSGRDMIVRKSVFKTFGAGVPVPSDGIGAELLFADGRYELVGIDKRMPGFTIMTQEVPDHVIRLGGREARLLELAGPGKPVDIKVRRVFFMRWR